MGTIGRAIILAFLALVVVSCGSSGTSDHDDIATQPSVNQSDDGSAGTGADPEGAVGGSEGTATDPEETAGQSGTKPATPADPGVSPAIPAIPGHAKGNPGGGSGGSGDVCYNTEFLGVWPNVDPNTRAITKIEITADSNVYTVHMWGSCSPTDCDWGTVTTPLSDADDGMLELFWDQGFATRTQELTLSSSGDLQLYNFNQYFDDSGRSDRVEYLSYYRESIPEYTSTDFCDAGGNGGTGGGGGGDNGNGGNGGGGNDNSAICNSVTWTKYGTSAVLSTGPEGSWDSIHVFHPSILFNGTIFQMWYEGYGLSGGGIGYATSPDGINWTKYGTSAVMSPGPDSWDRNRLTTPHVIFDGSEYQMWYAGGDGTRFAMGYATSPDGITWTKHGTSLVFNPDSTGWDSYSIYGQSVIYDGSNYQMWYTGNYVRGLNSSVRIGYATSFDGITWTRQSSYPVLDVGAYGSWDDYYVAYPSVISDGTGYQMWYVGHGGYTALIGHATSTNGMIWDKDISSPVLLKGVYGDWDDKFISNPSVMYDGTCHYMLYSGASKAGGGWNIGLAVKN